jgi:class 3 adenylate cyclase
MGGDPVMLTADRRRIEAEVERQNLAWEIAAHRVLATLIGFAVAMLIALSPAIGMRLAAPEIALCVIAIVYLLLASQLLARGVLSWREAFRWLGGTVEASFVTVALLICLRVQGPVWTITSPMVFLSALAIVGSTMRMRPLLTLYVSLVSAAEWLLLYYVALAPRLPAEELALVPTLAPWAAWERGFWITLVGGAAAYATFKIKSAALSSRVSAYQRQQLADQLGRFVPRDVAPMVLEGRLHVGTAERRHVTVLFCDLRDFTGLCEREAPEDVLAMLNAFYERAVRIIGAHGGHVNKFLGDGVLAIFGAPDHHPRHAAAACEAARQLQVAAAELRVEGGIWELMRVGVGVDTGDVVVGGLGSPDRMEYAAIGATVNRAARLQSLSTAAERRIIVSESTAAEAGPMPDLVPLGEVIVKGVGKPTMVYMLRSPLTRSA